MSENLTALFEENTLQKHMIKCFQWMFGGLIITAIVAYLVIATEFNLDIMYYARLSGIGASFILLIPLFIQLGVVIYLSARLAEMSVLMSRVMFIIYSVITGITFSFLPSIYGVDTMFLAFGFTAILFGSFVVIGNTLKMDLTKFRTLIVGGLITLVLVSVVSFILNISTLDMVICYAGLGLFLVITAYDIQKIKKNYLIAQGSDVVLDKLAIYGALELYLDFVNIFLYVVRILGRKK